MTAKERDIYDKALEYATLKHSGQKRKIDEYYITHPIDTTQKRKVAEDYITHPIAVAQMLQDKGFGLDYLLTALFHDLLEDTKAKKEEILALSNNVVLEAVILLTKEKGFIIQDYIDNICNNKIAKEVKTADRLHNLQCALETSPEFKKRYILDTVEWYLDFSPEILEATKALAMSLPRPIEDLSFFCKNK